MHGYLEQFPFVQLQQTHPNTQQLAFHFNNMVLRPYLESVGLLNLQCGIKVEATQECLRKMQLLISMMHERVMYLEHTHKDLKVQQDAVEHEDPSVLVRITNEFKDLRTSVHREMTFTRAALFILVSIVHEVRKG